MVSSSSPFSPSAVEIGAGGPALAAAARAAARERGAARNPAGEIAHQAFQHLQLGDDLLFLGQAALFDLAADFAQPRAGFMQRGLEFQMALAQMREFLGDTARLSRRRAKPAAICCTTDKAHDARTGSPPASR